MNESYLDTHNKCQCSGCGACVSICSHSAIEMKEDNEGFLYPFINSDKCTNCGLCKKTCPVFRQDVSNTGLDQKAYLAYKSPKEYYKKSATIGLCTKISRDFIIDGGLVVGVSLDNQTWKPNHILIENLSGLDELSNSKYAQSDTRNTFKETKQLLREGERVLYIGTPCQIAGLKAYLGKDYDNLCLIDIICHGVFSYRLLQREIEYWEKRYKGKITTFKFRSKKFYPWSLGGVVNFDISSENKKERHVEKHARLSLTYRCFAYSGDGKCYNLRPSCYNCPFRDKGRYGDITIGDAWGIPKYYPHLFTISNCRHGISLVLANNQKGDEIVRSLNDFCTWSQIPTIHAFTQPALLPDKMTIPSERAVLYDKFDRANYKEVVESILNVNFDELEKREYLILYNRLIKRPLLNLVRLMLGKGVKQWI